MNTDCTMPLTPRDRLTKSEELLSAGSPKERFKIGDQIFLVTPEERDGLNVSINDGHGYVETFHYRRVVDGLEFDHSNPLLGTPMPDLAALGIDAIKFDALAATPEDSPEAELRGDSILRRLGEQYRVALRK